MSKFAQKLISIRKSRGLSQRGLAEMTGINRSTISMWELGEREPGFDQVNDLAAALSVSVSELIDDKDNKDDILYRMQRRDEEDELSRYLEMLRTRPEMRVLLDTVNGATKEEVEANVRFLEAMRGVKG